MIRAPVLREHATHDITVNFNAKSKAQLLGDAYVAEARPPCLELDNGGNEFWRRPFRSRFLLRNGRRKEEAILAVDQSFVKSVQGGRLENRGDLTDTARADEQCRQTQKESIQGGQIRRPLPGAIHDQQLVLEYQRFGGDGANAARSHHLSEGNEQVDSQKDEIAHRLNAITSDNQCKTARSARCALRLSNSHPTRPESYASTCPLPTDNAGGLRR